jgi:hypothetical protein
MVKIQIHLCFKIIKVKMQDVQQMVHKMNLRYGLLEMVVHYVIFKMKMPQTRDNVIFQVVEV